MKAKIPFVTPCVGVWIETVLFGWSRIALPVTPCVGVWIETIAALLNACAEIVTPCVGVWIETMPGRTPPPARPWSHPAWVCGLKLESIIMTFDEPSVTPCVGVWIETKRPIRIRLRPYRHTLRGCVDWNNRQHILQYFHPVTPCVGVWIETKHRNLFVPSSMSHPAWVCGLKQSYFQK